MAVLGLVTFVLEPGGTLAYLSFLRFEQVGAVRNLSPYQLSPVIWLVLVVALAVLALRTLARALRMACGGHALGPRQPSPADVHALDAGRREGRSAARRRPPTGPFG